MENLPLVSIILPTYKSNESLKRAINSCLKQSYKNIEIIVVDDNNPNSNYRKTTEKIMDEFKDNSNVVYVKHSMNKNGAAARNTGFNNSKGSYISFLDDDDIFIDSKVEKQVNYLEENSNFQAVYSWRYQNNNIIKSTKTGDLSMELLSLTFTPYTSSIMIRKECYASLNGFNESYSRHQDYEFLLRFFERYSIGVVNEPLVEIIGNGINNTLHGEKLEKLKEKFLNDFEKHINRLNKSHKGFKKLVYSKHYSAVFWSYFKRKNFINASRVFIACSFQYGFLFWKNVFQKLYRYSSIKLQIMRRHKFL